MSTLFNLIVVVQVLSALIIIGLVLLQHGKGADMGAAFGSGASGSLFGATGSSNFMSKSTGIAAAVFFISTLALAHDATTRSGGAKSGGGLMERTSAPATPASSIPATAPVAAPAAATAPAGSAPAAAAPAASPAAPVNQIPK
jgi:preprotein translocase subunit SecG